MTNAANAVTHGKSGIKGEGEMVQPESDDKRMIETHKGGISATWGLERWGTAEHHFSVILR